MKYGSSNTNTFWNANGGSFAATRVGYTITPAQAWVRDGDNQTFDETINYAATDVCPNLANGNEEVTLKVKWLGNLCTITFDPNGGTFNSNASNTTKTLRYGTPTTGTFWNANGGTYDATRVGYAIEPAQAWFRTTDNKTFDETANYAGEDVCQNLASGDKTVTLKVKWVAKSIKVTFNCNSGSGTTSKTYVAGATGNKFINPCTKSGYTMLGWSASNDATSATWSPENGVTDNWISNNSPEKTIYAVWAKNYTLSYDKNGGTGGSTTATTCLHGRDCTVATNGFKKTGYTFTGWNTKADGTGTAYANGSTIQLTSNKTLYARWRINVVKIRYKINSGETIDTGTGQGFTNVNGFATKNGTNIIHTVRYGESMGDAGLADYNNSTWLNISRNHNCVAISGSQWKSGTKTYNQATVYTASQLCSTIADGDCTLDLSVNWGHVATIKYNMNGGSLNSTHGSTIGHSGQWITVSSSTEALRLYHGCTTSDDGLANYNNTTYININKPSGKNNPASGREWNTKANGTGTNYNQATVYRGSDFCNAATADCTKELYVNWR